MNMTEQNESQTEYVPVPDGIYRGKLVKTMEMESKEKKRPMIRLTWELQDAPYGGKLLNSYIVLDNQKSLWIMSELARFLVAEGYEQVDLDLDDLSNLIDKQCMLMIELIEINGKKYNNVKRYAAIPQS
jgi:hypothetical protein